MKVLGYAELRDGEVRISRAEDGALFNGDARLDGLLLSRLDFDLQVLDVPPVNNSEVEGLLGFRLRSIYPGNPQETAFDYRIVQSGKTRRAVVFIAPKRVLEKYRKASGQKPLFLPYALVWRLALKKRNLRVWYCQRNWAELSVFRGGLLVSSTVHRREEGSALELSAAEAGLPEDVRALPALLVAESGELARIRKSSGGSLPDGIATLTPREVLASAGRLEGLFGARKRRQAALSAPVRIGALATLAVVLSILLFFKYVASVEDRYEGLRKRHAALEQVSRRTVAAEKETEGLKTDLSRLSAREPEDLYVLFSELTRVLSGSAQILSITVRERSFQVEAVGTNPLKLMEGFRARAAFEDVRLSQVVPDASSGRERFSFSGGFLAR